MLLLIDISNMVYEEIKALLIATYPKQTPYGTKGIGFDDNNITSYISTSYTPKAPYDFCTIIFDNNVQVGETVGSAKETFSRNTIIIDIYSKNEADTRPNKEAIQQRAKEIMATVNDKMGDLGFRRRQSLEDSNHQGTGIYRVSNIYSRLVGKNDIE